MPIVTRTVNGVSQGINSFDLDQHTGIVNEISTEQTFISFLQNSTRFIEQIAENFSSLRDGLKDGGLAYVESSEGTSWLPYTLGGTYYPKGWYAWDGAQWITSKSNVAETLEALEGSVGGAHFSGDYNDLTNKPTITSGTNISFFQVQDDGVTGQAVTNGYLDAIALWDTPSSTSSDFSWA